MDQSGVCEVGDDLLDNGVPAMVGFCGDEVLAAVGETWA